MKGVCAASLAVMLGAASVAWSAPTVQVKGGQTTFSLAEPVVEALQGCELERVKPAIVKPQGDQLRLTVSGGVLDRETLAGEIEHRGGLSLSCFGGESVVSLQNFRVDTTVEPWLISAMAAIDGELQGRLPVLVPAGQPDVELSNGNLVRLQGLEVTLTQELVDLFLAEIGLVASTEDIIGLVGSRVKLRSEDRRSEDDEDDAESDDQGNASASSRKGDKDKPQKDKSQGSDDEDDEEGDDD